MEESNITAVLRNAYFSEDDLLPCAYGTGVSNEMVTETVVGIIQLRQEVKIVPDYYMGKMNEIDLSNEVDAAVHRAKHLLADTLAEKYVKAEVFLEDNRVEANVYLPLILTEELQKLRESKKALRIEMESWRRVSHIKGRTIERLKKQLAYEKLPFWKKWYTDKGEYYNVK